jgi:hypothetical protein
VAARSGYDVIMHDVRDELVERGFTAIGKSLQRDVDKERISADEKQRIVSRVRGTTDFATFRGASIVVEAVVENLAVKTEVFKSLDEITPPDAILASNTSSISITKLAAATQRPDKVIGYALHESGAGDEAGGSYSRHGDFGRNLPTRANALGKVGQNRPRMSGFARIRLQPRINADDQ